MSGHGVATTTTARARIASPLNPQASAASTSVAEERGVAIGHPDERRPLRLCVFDQSHQRGIRAFGGRVRGLELERRTCIGCTAEHRHPNSDGDWQRLAGQGARVDNRLGAQYRAVHRDHLSGADEHDISGLNLLHRHRLNPPAPSPLSDLGRALHERGQLAPSAARGHVLERGPPGEHQADDNAGELLPEQECADHCHKRDRVHTHVAVDHNRAGDIHRQLHGQ